MNIFVCMFVCVSVCEHISRTTHPIFAKFLLHVIYGCGSVFRWHHCDVLGTGYMYLYG